MLRKMHIFDAKSTEEFCGRKFVPFHIGYYSRLLPELGYRIVSYWDSNKWYDGYYCYPGHHGHHTKESDDQNAPFQGMTTEHGAF